MTKVETITAILAKIQDAVALCQSIPNNPEMQLVIDTLHLSNARLGAVAWDEAMVSDFVEKDNDESELNTARNKAIDAIGAYNAALNAEDAAFDEARKLRDKARVLEAQADATVVTADRVRENAEDAYDIALAASLARRNNE